MSTRDARVCQLTEVRLRQIQPARCPMTELHGYFFPHFIATDANARSDRHREILRRRSEFRMERAQSVPHNPRRSAPPTRMHRCHGAIPPIGDEDRITIRGPDRHLNAWLDRDQGVAVASRAHAVHA